MPEADVLDSSEQRSLAPESLQEQGATLFQELSTITRPEQHNIHRRLTKIWTTLTTKKTLEDQELLWTQTKDVFYPHFASEAPGGGNGDIVIEVYGDKSKSNVESYVVQLNRIKGNRERPYKIKITRSGVQLLERNDATGKFEPKEEGVSLADLQEHLINELQETVQQLREK